MFRHAWWRNHNGEATSYGNIKWPQARLSSLSIAPDSGLPLSKLRLRYQEANSTWLSDRNWYSVGYSAFFRLWAGKAFKNNAICRKHASWLLLGVLKETLNNPFEFSNQPIIIFVSVLNDFVFSPSCVKRTYQRTYRCRFYKSKTISR